MTTLCLLLATLVTTACSDAADEGTIDLHPADAKADGTVEATLELSLAFPTQKLRVACDEWFSCDLEIASRFSGEDIMTALELSQSDDAVNQYPSLSRGSLEVGANVYRDGALIWTGSLLGSANAQGQIIVNGFVPASTGNGGLPLDPSVWDSESNTLHLKGDKQSVFIVEFTLTPRMTDIFLATLLQQLDVSSHATWW